MNTPKQVVVTLLDVTTAIIDEADPATQTLSLTNISGGLTLRLPKFDSDSNYNRLFLYFIGDKGSSPLMDVPWQSGVDSVASVEPTYLKNYEAGDRLIAKGMILLNDSIWQATGETSYRIVT